MRVRNSRRRKVSAEWRDPIRITLPYPRLNKLKAAEDERPQENLAQLRVPPIATASLSALISINSPAAVTRPSTRQRRPEIIVISPVNSPGPCVAIWRSPARSRLHNLHASRYQDEKRHLRIAGLEQDLSLLHLSQLATRTNAVDLRLRQDGKSLGPSIKCAGYWWRRHFSSEATGTAPFRQRTIYRT